MYMKTKELGWKENREDGMHGAPRSYAGLLQSRNSQYLTTEEIEFVAAQKELLAEITARYVALQKGVLE